MKSRKHAIGSVLNREALRRMAGVRSFERGEEYFNSGLVSNLVEKNETLSAMVRGTRQYMVRLWVDNGKLDYSCTCPVGDDGMFCKHCVVVGLTWLEEANGKVKRKSPEAPAVTLEDVRACLEGEDKNSLIDMLIERAKDDERLERRLLAKTAKKRAKGLNLSAYRKAIDVAVDTDGFVDYRSAYGYADGVMEVIDSIDELLKDGYAAEAVELAEYALREVEEALGSIDDSDGHMNEIFYRLEELHLMACKKARPDPEALARRLFEWQMRTEWDTFRNAAVTYSKILGEKGLAAYRRLAEAEWARIPALVPGGKDSEMYGRRFRITSIMETLARQTGDVETLIEVKKRDLSKPYSYLEIAETYKKAKKHDLALEWAEKGVKAFPDRPDDRLHDFLAGEYHRLKRHDEAMALVWKGFKGAPHIDEYRKFKGHADRTGQWPAWREKALDYMRKRVAERRGPWRADHSQLVRVFLWEKDVEAAWREAKSDGCTDDLWMELASKREKAHPEDALTVYQGQVEPVLARKNNEAYREAVGLLRKVQGLMARIGKEADFPQYLEVVRQKHKPKRNFIKMLDRAKW